MTEQIEGMQQLHDTDANLTSNGTVLKEAEFFHGTDTDRVRIGDGSTQGKNRPYFYDSNHEGYIQRLNGLYSGKLLSDNAENAAEITSAGVQPPRDRYAVEDAIPYERGDYALLVGLVLW